MVNSPLIRPYLLGGVALGGSLDSHDLGKGCASCQNSTFLTQLDHLRRCYSAILVSQGISQPPKNHAGKKTPHLGIQNIEPFLCQTLMHFILGVPTSYTP